MQLPPSFLASLQKLPGFNKQDFVNVHQSNVQSASIRLHPLKQEGVVKSFDEKGVSSVKIPWSSSGYYLSKRPSFTFDPLFHAGSYYVQEASSMFLDQALQQVADVSRPLKVLDLCAAPGGKSTLIQALLSENSLLVSNDVIRQRSHILKDNIIKWGCRNVVVTHSDPNVFSKLKGFFDIVVVDAPCSGSGLFRKDAAAVEEWSEKNVMLCSQRQQRIIADVLPALKEGGILIYSTCSYSEQENEMIANWFCEAFPVSGCRLKTDPSWGVTEVVTGRGAFGYRFWPHLINGEGFFLSVFRKEKADVFKTKMNTFIRPITKHTAALITPWMNTTNVDLIGVNDKVYAWPKELRNDFDVLLQTLRVVYSGTLVGELAHHKFIPGHALAMSPLIKEEVPRVATDLKTAIAYLQKKNIDLIENAKGWHLITYKNKNLGWVNILPNRINNYYPKELRIVKEEE